MAVASHTGRSGHKGDDGAAAEVVPWVRWSSYVLIQATDVWAAIV